MTSCQRAGCTGGIEDGYCDVCGMAPATMRAASGSGSPGRSPSGRVGRARPTRTTSTGSSGRSGRSTLGMGLVEVPPVSAQDPAQAIMVKPEVPEWRRFCGNCDQPVGRGRGGAAGRTEGFCAKCGTAFSFTPKLAKGDLVGGQYEVLGCLAHGGLGWIYLARDLNVEGRWVVLKGLLNTADADAMAATVAERRFLAEVEHPNIVKIYNFVQHPDPRTQAMTGYIVMEYVGGRSLKDIAVSRRAEGGGSLALPQVIAYALEVLRALGYLHARGLLYCDFKPDNVIQTEDHLKLIDLGGVRRADDVDSPIYGTVGYQAPEIATAGPSISSDLYTVARSLAVLSFEFKGFTNTFAITLPDNVPLLARHESYDRFLRRATHPDPSMRFGDALEMADQLTGVLREVLATEDGRPRPAPSTLFGPEQQAVGTELAAEDEGTVLGSLDPAAAAAVLPLPAVPADDPAAGFLAGLTGLDAAALVSALLAAPESSTEVRVRLARTYVELGRLSEAYRILDEVAARAPGDWRVDWHRGLATLAGGRFAAARAIYDDLYDLMPGESAPKLALAFSAECAGDQVTAACYYELVWRTDHSYVSAAFGLARMRLAGRDRPGAMQVLDSIPKTSSYYVAAQVAAVAAAVRGHRPAEPDLLGAGARLAALNLDAERRGRLAVEVLEAALSVVEADPGAESDKPFLDGPLTERGVRRDLERTYRALARLAQSTGDRQQLVDRANTVRPKTLL